jgi:ABC-type enterochelin transport system permease subunit
LSDFVGAIVDFPVEVAINITLGCLAIIPLVWLYLFVKKD